MPTMATLRELTHGFDLRRAALTGGVAVTAAGLLCLGGMSFVPFPRYLAGSLLFAFAIALALTVSGNLRTSRVPPVLLHGVGVLVAAGLVTLGLFALEASQLLRLRNAPEHPTRLSSLIMLGLVIGVVMAFVMLLRERHLADRARHEARERLLEKQVVQARLQLLQAQVEPHFLFNTLASVQRLVATDPPAAHAMLEDLNQYLRASLPDMRESHSTVGREADRARAFLNIMQVRLGARLACQVSVPEGLRELPFPPMMLPSLVENAVEHGLGDRAHGRIDVTAHSGPGWLELRVCDDGSSFDTHAAPGTGLTNIRERLSALYGAAGRLSLEAPAAGGLTATIRIPHLPHLSHLPHTPPTPHAGA